MSTEEPDEDTNPEFVLDMDSNPHRRLLDRALSHRRLARMAPGDLVLGLRWLTYLEAMCDATGLPPDQLDAWVANHETFDAAVALARPLPVKITQKSRR